jgi:hypothetical protein
MSFDVEFLGRLRSPPFFLPRRLLPPSQHARVQVSSVPVPYVKLPPFLAPRRLDFSYACMRHALRAAACA